MSSEIAKDAWYRGPAMVQENGKIFFRMPGQFYKNKTGPSKKNCFFLAQREVSEFDDRNLRFVFPSQRSETTPKLKEGVLFDVDDEESGIMGIQQNSDDEPVYFLGDSSIDQPIIFLEIDYYLIFFTMPKSMKPPLSEVLSLQTVESVLKELQFSVLITNGTDVCSAKFFDSPILGPHFRAQVRPNHFVFFGIPVAKIFEYVKQDEDGINVDLSNTWRLQKNDASYAGFNDNHKIV